MHVPSEKWERNWLGFFLAKRFERNRLKDKVRSLLPTYVNTVYMSLSRSKTNVKKPVMSDKFREVLINELIGDINQLRNYTVNEFKHWCV